MEYYRSEYVKFREIMCSKKYTPQQKIGAFGGLVMVYTHVKTTNKKDQESIIISMQALKIEFDMRLKYELFEKFQK
ncbi:hypothetical protein LCGC14_0437500 [marine sediment metagenome]|uniref:Uncharacterized protein n=1 Tax=marine sediment metagenome TaxID=412755 RepID=A0A0F9SSN9_9ZZZZ